jgi:hypothetical protein
MKSDWYRTELEREINKLEPCEREGRIKRIERNMKYAVEQQKRFWINNTRTISTFSREKLNYFEEKCGPYGGKRIPEEQKEDIQVKTILKEPESKIEEEIKEKKVKAR